MFRKIALFMIASVMSGATAPDFHLKDAKGRAVSLARYKGKVVVLDFWATWCHGCKTEIPWFMEFAKRYKHQGLVVIGVAMDEDGWKLVAPYVREKKMNYPVVVGNGAVAKPYGADENLPVTVLIDRRGEIVDAHTGVVDKDAWEAHIQEQLAMRR